MDTVPSGGEAPSQDFAADNPTQLSQMSRRSPVKSTSALEAIRPFRARIGLTYVLNIVEDLLELSYPWATGLAIDGLIDGKWIEAVPLIAAWGLRALIGIFRKMFDTRVYTSVYNAIVTDTILRQKKAGVKTTGLAARSAMAREFVTFFERDVPIIATAIIGVVGSAAILFYYDLIIGAAVTVLFLPVFLINRVYSRHTLMLNTGLNNQLEREVQIIERDEAGALKKHFEDVRCWRMKLSDAEAWNWGIVEILSILVFVAVLARATYLPNTETGDIFAILSYVWRLMENLDHIPEIVQQLSRLIDIRKRIEAGASIEAVGAEIEKAHEEKVEAAP
jgi:ABC-type multidrug transport system fused ATPase/permease subunit